MKSKFMTQLLQELNGIYSGEQLREINEIIDCYNKYDGIGLDDWEDRSKDYIPTKKVSNFIAELIDKEARFMFGEFPYITVECENEDAKMKIEHAIKDINNKNNMAAEYIKAAKDCFIGKRVAIKLNAQEGDRKRGIKILFKNSLEFVFETDLEDTKKLSKLIFYYKVKDSSVREQEVWWKQKYELNEQGYCILNEGKYNGNGELLEEYYSDFNTKLDFIPGGVIVNDGLSGDTKGRSDVTKLISSQLDYNRIDSEDTDALLKGMNQIKYTIDAAPQIGDDGKELSLPLGPGAYWDIQSSETRENVQAKAGVLGVDFNYAEKLNSKLDRNKNTMYELMNIPQIDLKELSGVMTSGKSMKALYWQMILRIKEKFTAWKPALENMYKDAIEMSKIYKLYDIPDIEYDINVEFNSPLPEDELEEMQADLLKVNAQAMSRLQFITKWFECSTDEAEDILQQIGKEKELLEDSYSAMQEDIGDEQLEDEEEEDIEEIEGSDE